jgi:hypothetical protein
MTLISALKKKIISNGENRVVETAALGLTV